METADQRVEGTDTAATVLAVQLAVLGVVLFTALYAPHENSERAFRLLDWMKGSS
ncbi:hypothetical protein ACFYO2_47440 [Streptomyces sp. NPDC006602]|uniref:hypothetical protein n=1 Tax=Streptomyces sp. NPDC006602 TaxID=3364751 RepID=UPI0036A0B12F